MNYLEEVKEIISRGLFDIVFKKFEVEIKTFPASLSNHHCESGGYIRHVWEVLVFTKRLYDAIDDGVAGNRVDMETLKKLAFIHDLDKLQRYEIDPVVPTDKQVKFALSLGIGIGVLDSKSSLSTKIDNKVNRTDKPAQYYRYRDQLKIDDPTRVVMLCGQLGIPLNEGEVHALAFHHGGWSTIKGEMSPLATVLHCADLMSAKVLGGGV